MVCKQFLSYLYLAPVRRVKNVFLLDNVKRWNDEIVARENALTNAKNLVENQQESVTLYTNELKILNEKLKEKRTAVGTLEKATDLVCVANIVTIIFLFKVKI